MSRKPTYDLEMRLLAVELFESGHGWKSAARTLGVPVEAVRNWLTTYRAVGIEGLSTMGSSHAHYSFEVKVAAARAVAEEGTSVPEAMARFAVASKSSLKQWVRAYREGGPEALRPKPRGRPRGSRSAPKETTREQELERRIERLEAENAYLKKSIALKAEKRSRTARRPRS